MVSKPGIKKGDAHVQSGTFHESTEYFDLLRFLREWPMIVRCDEVGNMCTFKLGDDRRCRTVVSKFIHRRHGLPQR